MKIRNSILFQCFYATGLLLLSSLNLIGQSQQYLHFDRIDDFVKVEDASKYIANGEGLTMTGWFYCDELGYGQGLFGFRNGGSNDDQMYMIQLNNGLLENRYITSQGFDEYVTPSFTMLPEQWQHYAWIWDGSKVLLYLNGDLVGSSPAHSTAFTSMDTPFAIGQIISPYNFFYGGRIDEVSLWSKALTEEEIEDMIENELVGDEEGLELYYKFNQGVPDGDNTSLSKLFCEVGDGERDGSLENFALTGTSSNFGGELDVSFQAISFPIIPDKLITDDPFQLEAISTSGLEVIYEILSGPATLEGNIVTLDGSVGEVLVRASQPGDDVYDPAVDIENTFMVLDAQTYTPVIDVRAPLMDTEVILPTLGPIQLAAIVSIGSPELFNVAQVEFEINDEKFLAKDWQNDHYTAWWTPAEYGDVEMKIIASNNYGAKSTTTVNFEVVNTLSYVAVNAATDVHLSVNKSEEIVTAELPNSVGAFNVVLATLDIACPDGGCDPWDRISSVEVKAHNGEWYEIIHYITPYGIACNHDVDLVDFSSLLYGKVDFKFKLGTQGNGYLYTLDFDFIDGAPDHAYSRVDKLWNATYKFGDMEELQPYESKIINFDENAKTSLVKLVASGHGWGANNTGNAAEFHNDTHHLMVNGAATFEHNNWLDCDPNPDGCNDQLGTWYHNRAGWCPGAIAPWNDFDMTPFLDMTNIEVKYRLDEDYVDFCNASNPDCVTDVTCDNCNDGYNPHLITASYIITYGDMPLDNSAVVDVKPVLESLAFSVYPNPASKYIELEYDLELEVKSISILNTMGMQVKRIPASRTAFHLVDLSDLKPGMYFVELKTKDSRGVQRLIIE